MAELKIRQYEPGGEDAVWALHERALRDVGAYDEEFAHLDADVRNVESEYLDAGGEFLVGEVDGAIVAMGAVQPVSKVDHHDHSDARGHDQDHEMVGVVRRMRVDPDHQRRGYGSEILTALESRAQDLEFERLVLDTTPDQTAARGLYESFGYAETHREETPVGEMIYYAKSL